MPNSIAIPDAPTLQERCEKFLHRAERIRIHHVIAGVLQLGQAAVEELYSGDMNLVHDRSASQDAPLHALMHKHSHRLKFLGITVEQVRASMRAYETNLALPTDVRGKLSPSHLRALAPIASIPDRTALAIHALEHTWSVEQTEAHVNSFRHKHGLIGKGGRKPVLVQLKIAAAASRGLAKLGDPATADALSASAKAELKAQLGGMKTTVDAWLARL